MRPFTPDRVSSGEFRMRDKFRDLGLSMLGAIGAACVLAIAPVSSATAQPTVTLDGVTVDGINWPITPGVNAFLGIRYAASPAGTARWTPPQSPGTPSGNATLYNNACPQGGATLQTALVTSLSPLSFQSVNQEEDCLFLNVFVPASAKHNSKLPVWVWIHGGALISGSGAQYDPSVMVAENDIIVVTINYRLGALGWLAESVLEPGGTGNSFQNAGDTGDYGLMDQQFALQWVRSNIRDFGGDPHKVTIGGESAGGLSVSSNLASTTTGAGLFRGAIIESGPYMFHSLPSQTEYEAEFASTFATDTGCTDPATEAACLRGTPLGTILSAQFENFGEFGISPDFGTLVLPQSLLTAFSTGEFNRVPVLQGTNANEGRLFEPGEVPFAGSFAAVVAAGGPANFDLSHSNSFCGGICTYPQEVGLYIGLLNPALDNLPFVTLLASEYPLANFPDPFLAGDAPSADEALSQIFTDVVFACNGLDSNGELSKYVPVFAYEFNDPNAPPGDQFGFPTASEHAAELQFLFNFGTPLTAGEQELATEMNTYWANFVKTGDPSFGNFFHFVPFWFPFNFFHNYQALVPGPQSPHPFFTFPEEHFCATWEPVLEAE
jgi:para-nitrobenzyl esterase